MLTRETLAQLNKELSAAVRLIIAKQENLPKGVIVRNIVTEREPSQDGHSFEYTIRISVQATKDVVEEETSP